MPPPIFLSTKVLFGSLFVNGFLPVLFSYIFSKPAFASNAAPATPAAIFPILVALAALSIPLTVVPASFALLSKN